jgi:hypothetical protein
MPGEQVHDVLSFLDALETPPLSRFTTEDEGKILAGRYEFRTADESTEKAIHLLKTHRFVGIVVVEELIEAVEFGVGQGIRDWHLEILPGGSG